MHGIPMPSTLKATAQQSTPQAPELNNIYLTIDETAKALKVTRRSIYDRINDGTLKPRRLGHKPLFLWSEIVATLELSVK